MREQLLVLYELQQADSALRRLERALAELDDGSAARAQAAQARQAADTATARLKGLEKELLNAELQLKGKEAKRKECEDKMYGGKVGNPKELSDLQQEVAMLTSNIDHLSDQVLELMDQVEAARVQAKEAEAVLAQHEAEATQAGERYQQESARLRAEVEEQAALRKAAAARVEPGLLRRYDDLRARKGGVAAVAVKEGMCGGCRTTLAVDVLRRVQAATAVVLCDNCGRILVMLA